MTRPTKTIDGPFGPMQVPVDATKDELLDAGFKQFLQHHGGVRQVSHDELTSGEKQLELFDGEQDGAEVNP